MSAKYLITLIPIVIFSLSCSKKSRNAPERTYYVEVRRHQTDAFNKELSEYLTSRIPQKKYTFTNRSGMTWPYYAAFELNEDVPIDSLMPPHWYIHKMILKDSTSILLKDDYLVRIDIMPHLDTILNYRVEIYEIDAIGLKLSGSSGIHYVDTVELYSTFQKTADISPHDLLYDHYLKSIIRYSFK